MKIQPIIEVPDGPFCGDCKQGYSGDCEIFGETVAFIDTGVEIKTYKHPQCHIAEVKVEP